MAKFVINEAGFQRSQTIEAHRIADDSGEVVDFQDESNETVALYFVQAKALIMKVAESPVKASKNKKKR